MIQRLLLIIFICICMTGCIKDEKTLDGELMENSYTQISQDEAKRMMKELDDYVIVDVRRKDEYDEGHIPGAVLIPNESINDSRPQELEDLDQVILIYCRSGNRSKQAAQKLSDIGYTKIYEFGGINTWDGEIVKENIEEDSKMKLFINEREVPVSWEDNDSVKEFSKLLPLEINMSMYGGFEQVGHIGQKISSNDVQLTTSYGDIVLYSSDQIVIFYGSNSWAYTKLGHIDLSKEEMSDLLGNSDVNIRLMK